MRLSSRIWACLGMLVLGCLGCPASRAVYIPPPGLPTLPDTRLVPEPLTTVWVTLATQAGPHGFVVQHQDRTAQILTLTYTGPLDRYVTCGELVPEGSFPLQLHSQIHLLLTAESATQTRLLTTVEYTLTFAGSRPQVWRTAGPLPLEPITFSSGQVGQSLLATPPLICKPTGVLEQEVFALVP
jgi:hypothetical protein